MTYKNDDKIFTSVHELKSEELEDKLLLSEQEKKERDDKDGEGEHLREMKNWGGLPGYYIKNKKLRWERWTAEEKKDFKDAKIDQKSELSLTV